MTKRDEGKKTNNNIDKFEFYINVRQNQPTSPNASYMLEETVSISCETREFTGGTNTERAAGVTPDPIKDTTKMARNLHNKGY